ncbi:MAG: DNA-binding response regulator [Acidobacteria bacterium]|nr:MAG: DNA-binding response regulator [Acidobacteriota bacterium]
MSALRTFLEREGFEVVAEASDGQEVMRVVPKLQPDIAIVDISMPLLNGLAATHELKTSSPRTKVVVVTQHDEDQYVVESIRAGVRGYVLKTQVATDLVEALRQVDRGGVYLSPGISRAIVQAYLSKSDFPPDPLTSRERQVLQHIGEGKSTKELAALMGISTKTAESHRARLMQKLDIHETASLVRYAIRRGLVQP